MQAITRHFLKIDGKSDIKRQRSKYSSGSLPSKDPISSLSQPVPFTQTDFAYLK